MSALSGRIEGETHVLPLRVYYEDTDAGGVVYHSNYLKYAERARSEMLRLVGIKQAELRERSGLVFAVFALSIAFKRPARFDDLLEVRSRLSALAGASITAEQRILRAAEELAQLVVKVALVTVDGRPARLPQDLRQALKPYLAAA